MNLLSPTFIPLTCLVIASDYSNSSLKGRKDDATLDFSHIDSVEGVQQKAVEVTKAFLNCMAQLPETVVRGEKHFKDIYSSSQQIVNFSSLAFFAQKFLPPGSEAYLRMEEVNGSSKRLQEEIESLSKTVCKKMGDRTVTFSVTSTIKDFTKYISFRVEAVKDIFYAIESIKIDELSFKELNNFSKFLNGLSNCLEVGEKDILAFKKKFKALKSRRTYIQFSVVDWKEIGELYASFMQRMIKILNSIHLDPKGTTTDTLSDVFSSLASTVIDVADLAPNKESIVNRIDEIVKEEKKIFKLYLAREKTGNQEGYDYDSHE